MFDDDTNWIVEQNINQTKSGKKLWLINAMFY